MVTSTGIDWKKRKTPIEKGSAQLPCLTAANIPTGIPTAKASDSKFVF
jgi:hypothetical protein